MLDTDGKPIVELPTKQVHFIFSTTISPDRLTRLPQVVIEKLQLSTLERRIYDSIYVDVKTKFDRLNAKGLVRKNYTHILAMLMRYGLINSNT